MVLYYLVWEAKIKGEEAANPPKQVTNRQTSLWFGVFSSISDHLSSAGAGGTRRQAGGCWGLRREPAGSRLLPRASFLLCKLPFLPQTMLRSLPACSPQLEPTA